MKIAIDAMGGDLAPKSTVQGALLARKLWGIESILVGDKALIQPLLDEAQEEMEIVHASETINFDEQPLRAIRQKKDASIVVAARLVADGRASALVAAGSTGAAMAASLLIYGRLKGIDRPAIAFPMPTLKGMSLILDGGANPEASATNLVDFALMGSIYMDKVLGVSNPKVGLINIGEEEIKGTQQVIEAYKLLTESNLNFVGNVEGRDITLGETDVLICDGFVGNILLKYTEGLAQGLFTLVKEAMLSNFQGKVGALLVKNNLKSIKARMDYSEYGGAPLLGLKKLTIISHGSSDQKAIANALRAANDASRKDIIRTTEEALEKRSNP